MTKAPTSPILKMIRRVAEDHRVKQMTDPELLRRFSSERDEAAFHSLVRRHGLMVLDVCRNVLGNEADAEDAFQATFLILAKKAAAIRKQGSVASWLYGVAYRTALKAQADSARRQKREAGTPTRPPADAADDLAWREVRQALHEELNRLSECYRAPLVLCYLQGKTQNEAATLLGVSRATMQKRLEHGRALLRVRLVRRGLGAVAVLLAAAWPVAKAAAQMPPLLVSATIKAATLFAAGQAAAAGTISARVAFLTQGVLKTMFLTKLKTTTAALLVAGLLVGGLLIAGLGAMPDSSLAQQAAGQNKVKAAKQEPAKKAAGRVKLRATLKGHSGNVHCVAFSPDGKLLASGSEDSTIKIWDTATGKEIKTLTGHQDIIWSLAFSPDGKSLASTSFNYKDPGKTPNSVKIWNVATWEEKVQLKDNKGGFKFCTFSPDGKVLAAASAYQNLAKLWDTMTGNRLGAILEDRRFGLSSLLFSPDGKTLILGAGVPAGEDALRLWNWAEQKPAGTFKTEGRGCDVVRFTRDGKTLVTCNELGDITFWDFDKARARRKVRVPVLLNIDYSLVLSPDGKMVAERDAWADTRDGVAVQKGKILLRDIATGQLFETIPVDGCQFTHRSMAFSPKGGMLAVGALENDGQGGIVRIWDVREPVTQRKR